MQNILLIHGLNGSGEHSSTGKTLKNFFGAGVYTPNLPNNPAAWYDFLDGYIGDHFALQPFVLLGNSTGGLLAASLAAEHQWPLVLINPVVEALDLAEFTGWNTKFASGDKWFFAREDVELLRQFDVIEAGVPTLIFLGKNDEVLDYRKAVHIFDKTAQMVINDNSHQYRLSQSDLETLQTFCR
ncbi:MAG: YqiA/YcfP family alpha/beta fold hydrolase [Thermodesulfobacteriota bacterium]